jgi:hypothetical protein
MKKAVLLIAIITLTFSCSKNDDSSSDPAHKVSFMLDGTTQTFDNVTVTEENEGTYAHVVAVNSNLTVSFIVFDETAAGEAFSDLHFTQNGIFYTQSEEFTSHVSINNMDGGRLKGKFSGALIGFDDQGTIMPGKTVTNGKFDVVY